MVPPVVKPEVDRVDGTALLSFRDLQEIRFLNAFRKHGVSWHVLRLASDEAKRMLDSAHPFSTGRFRSSGNAILMDVAVTSRDRGLLDIVRNQLVFRRIIEPYLKGLEFQGDEPVRWFPDESRRIVVDPTRRFGQPVLTREGVPTRILARAYKAEGSYAGVARWYSGHRRGQGGRRVRAPHQPQGGVRFILEFRSRRTSPTRCTPCAHRNAMRSDTSASGSRPTLAIRAG